MKIQSVNRSDVFDEYLNIISRYNNKTLIKEAYGYGRTAIHPIVGAEKATGKGAAELALELASKTISFIDPGRFAKAGVSSLEQLKRIYSLAQDLLNKEKYLIEESHSLRKATTEELSAINEWVKKNPNVDLTGGGVEFNKGIGTGSTTFRKVKTVTETNAVDYAKRIETGSSFTEKQAIEFRKITSDLIGESSPAATPPVSLGAVVDDELLRKVLENTEKIRRGQGRANSVMIAKADRAEALLKEIIEAQQSGNQDLVNNLKTQLKELNQGLEVEMRAGFQSVSDQISASKDAAFARITELESSLKTAIETGDQSAISTITASLNSQKEQIESLLTSNIASLKEGYTTQLTALREQLENARVTGNTELATRMSTEIQKMEEELSGKILELKGSSEQLAGKIDSLSGSIQKIEASAATTGRDVGAMKETLTSVRKEFDDLKKFNEKTVKELEEIKKSVKNAGEALTSADPKVKGYSSGWISNALLVLAAVGVGYVGYSMYSGSGSGTGTGVSPDSSREEGGGPTSDGGPATSGPPSSGTGVLSPDLQAKLDSGAELDNATLNEIARMYRASGYIVLKNPVLVKGKMIKYVFPARSRSGTDATISDLRSDAAQNYFSKVYTKDTERNALLRAQLAESSGSRDPQVIANNAFSRIANAALFSGKGTFLGLGNRGSVVGRGGSVKGYGEYGISGSTGRKLTKEERRAARRIMREDRRMSDADDYLADELDDAIADHLDYMDDDTSDYANDPMSAFASGQEEYFRKYTNKLNDSTNKLNSYEFAKKADKISNRYFKDAVEDLQDDEFMKAYYAGFSKLHNQKQKKQKPDYEKLYDVQDETGADLIHKAHPKAISVAEAIGNGGLVENASESSKAMEDVAFRVPSGNYRARYAFIQNALRKKS